MNTSMPIGFKPGNCPGCRAEDAQYQEFYPGTTDSFKIDHLDTCPKSRIIDVLGDTNLKAPNSNPVQHLPKAQENSRKTFPCRICNKILSNIQGLRQHNVYSINHKINVILAKQALTHCPATNCPKTFTPQKATAVIGHARSAHNSDVNIINNSVTGAKELYFTPK